MTAPVSRKTTVVAARAARSEDMPGDYPYAPCELIGIKHR
jgi:hypothetical protein